MLKQLAEFREQLDGIMIQDIHKRIILFGYDSYSGRFIRWYAKYYHNIEVDYLIALGYQRGVSHEQEVYTRELLEFDYKDVNNAIIWFCMPLTEEFVQYKQNREYRDWYQIIYGNDWVSEVFESDLYKRKKSGKRDIQFLEYLEWKYDCNFLQTVVTDTHSYSCSTQKEIFPILDAIHYFPTPNDAIFDFGCGKGGALVTFLDYGFKHAGGVEFDVELYRVLQSNITKLNLTGDDVEIICGDALDMDKELDGYNWFYFFSPLPKDLYSKVIDHICDSYRRKMRRIKIVAFNPTYSSYIENTGIFRLRTQVNVDTLKRVCDVFETYDRK